MQPTDVESIPRTTEQSDDAQSMFRRFFELIQPARLSVDVASDLAHLVAPGVADGLLERASSLRRQMAFELGLVLPGIRFAERPYLPPGRYVISVSEVPVDGGLLQTGRFLAIPGDGNLDDFPGTASREPIYGAPAAWITADQRDEAVRRGAGVYDPSSVVAIHLAEVARHHAAELLGHQEVRWLLDFVAGQQPELVAAVTPQPLSLGEVRGVLQQLLRERVSIRDITTILEALADLSAGTRAPLQLVEGVRAALRRQIRSSVSDARGIVHAVVLDEPLEERMLTAAREIVHRPAAGEPVHAPLDRATAEGLMRALAAARDRGRLEGVPVTLVVHPSIRLFLRRLLEPVFPQQPVLSWSEVLGPRVGVLRVQVREAISLGSPETKESEGDVNQ